MFKEMFLNTQKMIAIFVLPLGAGIYVYRDVITQIMFGDGWTEAANIVGIAAITTAIRTIYISFCVDAYRAKGKFKIPLLLQILDLAIMVPACLFTINHDFWLFVNVRSWIKLDLLIPEFILMWVVCKISFSRIVINTLPVIVSTIIMYIVAVGLRSISLTVTWSLVGISICIVVYFSVLCFFKEERKLIKNFLKNLINKKLN
jgi:PST family polysaccharide transporter